MRVNDDDESWRSRALCRRFTDVNFVPDPFLGEDSLPAKNVCAHCPVAVDCLAYAMRTDRLGVWGGTDEADRALLRTVAAVAALPGCPCGSGSPGVTTALGVVCTSCGTVSA
jgi:WhiB family redox-sensing transcriptional regulator